MAWHCCARLECVRGSQLHSLGSQSLETATIAIRHIMLPEAQLCENEKYVPAGNDERCGRAAGAMQWDLQ